MDTAIVTNKRKRIVKKAAVCFFIAVILLTFFSKTINSMLMPEVESTTYSSSSLDKEIDTICDIKPLDIERVNASGSMKITEIKVKEGDKVTKGSVLALADMGDMSLRLKSMELEIEKAENAYVAYKSQYNAAGKSDEDPNKKWLLKDLEEARKKYNEAMELYENGLEEYKGVQACQKEIDIINDKIDAIDKSREDYGRSLKEKEAELQLKRLELENLKKGFTGNGEIKSAIDGTVYSVSAEKDMTYNNGQQLFEIVPQGAGCRMEWKLNTAKAELFKEGDAIKFEIKGGEKASFGAAISKKKYIPAEGLYLYTTDLKQEDNKLKMGQAEINITKSSKEYPMVVPNSCIYPSAGGKKVVYILKQRNGALGEEYYVKSLEVTVQDSNDTDTAVSGALQENDDIVSFSSKALFDGARVKLR